MPRADLMLQREATEFWDAVKDDLGCRTVAAACRAIGVDQATASRNRAGLSPVTWKVIRLALKRVDPVALRGLDFILLTAGGPTTRKLRGR